MASAAASANVVAARHRPFAHRSFAIPAGAASARFARIHPASRAVPNSRSDVHSEIFKSASDSAAKRHVVSTAAPVDHTRGVASIRGNNRSSTRAFASARVATTRAHIVPTRRRVAAIFEWPFARIVESSRVFAAYTASLARLANARSDRDAPSRTNKSPSVARASVSAASRVAPPARHASGSTARSTARVIAANASSLVARSTAWRAVSANAASRRARSRARAVSVASAPTRITAKERARVGVKSSPPRLRRRPSASAFASFESFAFSFAFACVMVSGKAATHAAATRWASAEESGRAKKRREASAASSRAAESAGWDARRRDHASRAGARAARRSRVARHAACEETRYGRGVRLGGLRARNGAGGTRRGVGGGKGAVSRGIWALARRDLGVGGRTWTRMADLVSARRRDRRSRSRRAWSRSCARSPLSRDAPPRATRWVLLYWPSKKPWSGMARLARAPAHGDARAPRVVDAREI